MRLLLFCGALGAGEFAASFAPTFAEAWPVPAFVAVLVALFGYGLQIRLWPFLCVAALGVALFLFASTGRERQYRDQPWMRGRRARVVRAAAEETGPFAAARRMLARGVAVGLDHDRETAALNRAILLGERRRLPWRTKRIFVASGTMHVFAISGLHVMAVAGVLSSLLSLLFVPRRFAGAAAIPLLWGYVGVIGWSPSAVRAALMATFTFLAPVFWRRPDGLRAWALTFLAVHVWDPLMIVNVGCALSFLVMLAIVVAGGWGRTWGGWRTALATTVAAWAAGVPISAHVFGRVTPGGILANLVLISAAKLTVVSGAVGLVAGFVSTTLAAHLNNFAALFTRAMVFVADGVSRLPGASVETGRWPISVCAAWYALMLAAVALALAWRRRRAPF